jgi:hypothetical protein
MPEPKRSATLIKLGMYMLAVVLINMAGLTLFARFDLTGGRILSLSEASRKVVSTLSEPLTIDVFYSRNLPPPYNNVEQYLRDLLEEYAVYNQKFFNYRFHDVSATRGTFRPRPGTTRSWPVPMAFTRSRSRPSKRMRSSSSGRTWALS